MFNFKELKKCNKCAKRKACIKRVLAAAFVDGYLKRRRAKTKSKYWECKIFNADCYVEE